MSGSSNGPSWHVTTASVLAGIGAGYAVGVLTAKWWQWKGRRSTEASVQSNTALLAALSDLTSQVRNLHTALSEAIQHTGRNSRDRVASLVSDFVSAQGDTPGSEEEFFDLDGREEEEDDQVFVGSTRSVEYFDELGKKTLENEDACHTLTKELKDELAKSPNNVPMLWRLSRALVHLSMHSDQQGRVEEEKQLLLEAVEHAQKALGLDSEVWQNHQWYAVALGSQLKHEGSQRKITAGHEYKEHIDTAISLNPSDPTLYYLRGRWEYEVAGLSWLEKKAAAALYATPPESTFDEALGDFMQVESLNGGGTWKVNLMMIGKCHIKLGDTVTAMEWLNKSKQLSVITSEDKTAHKEVEELIATCTAD